MKALIKRVIGEGNLGRIEFFRQPDLRDSWGGPFNGQFYRLRIFADLLAEFRFAAIVETGTFRGTTTALFAATSLPVYTAEANPRYFAYSSMRFALNRRRVHLHLSDSRSFLRRLGNDARLATDDPFFYLDAHWHDDLPLRDELEIIFERWPRAVVMVDDFCVPGSGYGFDDYGTGAALTLDYIASTVDRFGLAVFFPAVDAGEESGMKRGSVVLCQEIASRSIAEHVMTLQRHAGVTDPGR